MIFAIPKSKNQADESFLESTSFFGLTKKAKCDEQLTPSSVQIMHPPQPAAHSDGLGAPAGASVS